MQADSSTILDSTHRLLILRVHTKSGYTSSNHSCTALVLWLMLLLNVLLHLGQLSFPCQRTLPQEGTAYLQLVDFPLALFVRYRLQLSFARRARLSIVQHLVDTLQAEVGPAADAKVSHTLYQTAADGTG